jgi:hypothetical protein
MRKGIAIVMVFALVAMGVALVMPTASADFGDHIYTIRVEAQTCDFQSLAVAYDGDYFYVSGGGNGGQNWLYMFDKNGIYLNRVRQTSTSYWGWIDFEYDDSTGHIYTTDYSRRTITEFSVIGMPSSPVLQIHATYPSPLAGNGVAYDPSTGHFWTSTWSSDLYEFDKTGAVISRFNDPYNAKIGLAWDDLSPGGPFLWVANQGGYFSGNNYIYQFDPINRVFTGVSILAQPPYYSPGGGLAAGLDLEEEWHTDFATFLYMSQSNTPSPGDFVKIFEGPEKGIPADVRIEPQSVNPDRQGNYMNVKVENFPENPEYGPCDIDGSTCKVSGIDCEVKWGTCNANRWIGKVDSELVCDLIPGPGDTCEFTVTGKIVGGPAFKGTCENKLVWHA